MEFVDIIILLITGFCAGFINISAAGGSLIALPILMSLGLPHQVANATNRVAVFFEGTTAVAGFLSKGINSIQYSLFLALPACIGTLFGVYAAQKIDAKTFNFVLIGIIVIVAFTLFKKKKSKENAPEKFDRKTKLKCASLFLIVGFYGGFIQAGVGFLIMTILSQVHNFTLVKANSIKAVIVPIYTTLAIAIFAYYGLINWQYGLIMAIGNSLGAWIASRWIVKKGDKMVKYIVAIMLTVMAVKLVIDIL